MKKSVVKRITPEEHLEMIRRHLISLKHKKRRERSTQPKQTMRRKMGPFRNYHCKLCSVVIVSKDFEPDCYKCGKKTEALLVPSL